MSNDFYRFQVGSFECIALCDGSADYSLESMVANAPRSEVEAYLQIFLIWLLRQKPWCWVNIFRPFPT